MLAEAVKLSWQRIVKKAGLVDLRFHDLRHEATSRFFEMELNVPEVALITGHRDSRMPFRYTHLKPENMAMKLDPEFSTRKFRKAEAKDLRVAKAPCFRRLSGKGRMQPGPALTRRSR